MKAALYDPEQGYYCRADRERWGRAGDYRTSPERSVLFAATFARYFARLHAAVGSPAEWTIVEAGAGGGHFAETILITLQQRFPEVFAAARYVIDEVSASSRSQTQARLARFGTRVEFKNLQELQTLNPGIVFANELLDAFPVHRVIMRQGELREFYVGLNDSGDFEWVIGTPVSGLSEQIGQHDLQLTNDQIAEISPGIEQWLQLVSSKLVKGFLIIVDYGAEASELYSSAERTKGTLRAFHRHQFAEDMLARVGEQDLTTSINWTLVRSVLSKKSFRVVTFDRQDKFLLSAGLLEELELRASEARSEAERLSLRTGAREMILPGGMAESFQVVVAEKV